MNEKEKCYWAGLFDGEGCISINKNKGSQNRPYRFCLFVSVSNTSLWLLELLKMQYGGSIHELLSCRNKGNKPCYQWTITTQVASNFLKIILPYLFLKKPQAELGILFQNRRINMKPLSDKDYIQQEADYILIKSMKQKVM